MSIVIVDEPLTAKLVRADGPLEVCARDGRVLGYFTPVGPPKQYKLEPQVSEEELDRRSRQKSGRKLADILADLEKRK
jgi:hypothetical protein